MSVHTDPTVHLVASPRLVELIRSSFPEPTPDTPLGVKRIVEKEDPPSKPTLTIIDIQWLSRSLATPLADLLLESSVSLPSPVPAPRSPQLEARCARLRAEQEHRDYEALTNNVASPNFKDKDPGVRAQLQEVQGFVILIVQFIVSVVCSFLFGFFSPYYILGRQELGFRLLCGIVAGFAVGCADMYFVIRHMLAEDGVRLVKKLD